MSLEASDHCAETQQYDGQDRLNSYVSKIGQDTSLSQPSMERTMCGFTELE